MGELTGPERDYASYMSSLAELVENRVLPMAPARTPASQLVICGVANCVHRLVIGRQSEENMGYTGGAIAGVLAVLAGEDDLW
jgi:hypothetical protein